MTRQLWINPPWFVWSLLVGFDALLSVVIVLRVPYTEIDWKAYMEQIAIYNSGERDYSHISGGTGPLVYPGGHVLIFRVLYWLTDEGKDLRRAQWIFVGVYLATLSIALSIYRKARIPFVYAALLVLSRRLHSIYMLRLFNDCIMTFFAVTAVRLIQDKWWLGSTVCFSLALAVKMSALLFLPGAAIIYFNELHLMSFLLGLPFGEIQVVVAWPFRHYLRSYFKGAFDFERQFLYKWTVNWKFISRGTFESSRFASVLLGLHGGLLIALADSSLGKSFSARSATRTILLANLIGVLCARSLHYQFYAWFYWTVPFLLADLPPAFIGLWVLLEYAWSVYPSTARSSGLSLIVLVILLVGSMVAASLPNKGSSDGSNVPRDVSPATPQRSTSPRAMRGGRRI